MHWGGGLLRYALGKEDYDILDKAIDDLSNFQAVLHLVNTLECGGQPKSVSLCPESAVYSVGMSPLQFTKLKNLEGAWSSVNVC